MDTGIPERLMMNAQEKQKKWLCLVCGYIHVGPEPPYACPICNAPQKMFQLLEEAPPHDPMA
jgi:rubrerythrin